jgi:hypothetical protein
MGRQRFRCLNCGRTFTWRLLANRLAREQRWFELWVRESIPVRLLSRLSGHSKSKLERIKNYWLGETPKDPSDLCVFRYLVYDATYFHKDGCLLSIMDALSQRIVSQSYVKKESFRAAFEWFSRLHHDGLDPAIITTDGERSILRAMKLVWPNARLQRCLYHLQHEGMRWLRTHPKTDAGRELRRILGTLSGIRTAQERDVFVHEYLTWRERHRESVLTLPRTMVAFKDLKRTMVLLDNALPDMFYYLDDERVHPTTNALESFHSRLKSDYQRHRGLTPKHRTRYLDWYRYFYNHRL